MKAPVRVSETTLFNADPGIWGSFLVHFFCLYCCRAGAMAAAQADCCTEMPLKGQLLFMSSAYSAACLTRYI